MFYNTEVTRINKELEELKREYASLQSLRVVDNTKAQELEKQLQAKVNELIAVGNPSFTSIMQTLSPILQEQREKAKISDSFFGNAFCQSLNMAMQLAYTAEEKVKQLALQAKELLIREQELEIKKEQLELAKKELELKEKQLEQVDISIRDNRYLKAIEYTGSIISMATSGGKVVPKGIYSLYFGLMNTLLGLSGANAYEGEEGTGLQGNGSGSSGSSGNNVGNIIGEDGLKGNFEVEQGEYKIYKQIAEQHAKNEFKYNLPQNLKTFMHSQLGIHSNAGSNISGIAIEKPSGYVGAIWDKMQELSQLNAKATGLTAGTAVSQANQILAITEEYRAMNKDVWKCHEYLYYYRQAMQTLINTSPA